ncbi:MAG: hypothetical protein EOO52_02455 [Gammaproteobacteria bacterium]|nr:MAG: hypothetical protein EOO52_02455 [Gammaproteobacteria bacterium]
MNKKKILKCLTILVTIYLMLSLAPEIRMFGAIVDIIGLEVFFLLLASYLVIALKQIYDGTLKWMLSWLNEKFERIDPFYFVPTINQLEECPQLIFHSVPFFVSVSFLLFAQVSLFS